MKFIGMRSRLNKKDLSLMVSKELETDIKESALDSFGIPINEKDEKNIIILAG